MGVLHGLYCAGCCWALMALMFFAGTMNLLWIAGLALLMFVEKVLPGGRQLGYAVGVALVVWGLNVLGTDVLSLW
jgi:predicted metal-binding membrane protein